MNDYKNITTTNIESEETKFFRYAVVVEYNGSSFAGSQKQPEQRTVQSEMETALSILAKTDIKVVFSGRTDSGVHARGQVAHFDIDYQIDTNKFLHSLNAILPSDISASLMIEVDHEFHSQKSALYRWYRYTINNKSHRSVWLNESLCVQTKLNIKEMNKALTYLKGTHDFSSFKSMRSTNPICECTLYYAGCKSEDGIIHIDFIANRFVYNMIRIIVGTLLPIGKELMPANHMQEVLDFKDRTQAGPTAKPEGLTLMAVNYDKKYNLSDYLNMEAIYNENLLCKAS